MKRGDVVIVEFPYVDGRRYKNRPALILPIAENPAVLVKIADCLDDNDHHVSVRKGGSSGLVAGSA